RLRQRGPVGEPRHPGGAERDRLRPVARRLAARAVRDRARARQDRRGIAAQGDGIVGSAVLPAAAVAGAGSADHGDDRVRGLPQHPPVEGTRRTEDRAMKPLLGKYSNSAMTLVMLGIFLVLVGIATRYPAEARFMPFVVGIPPIILCLIQLVLDARDRRRA